MQVDKLNWMHDDNKHRGPKHNYVPLIKYLQTRNLSDTGRAEKSRRVIAVPSEHGQWSVVSSISYSNCIRMRHSDFHALIMHSNLCQFGNIDFQEPLFYVIYI